MIVYFADRQLKILGHASTELPEGLIVTNDLKTEDIETGVSVFECKIPFDEKTRAKAEAWASVGNHILRSHNSENEFYTIIDTEVDTKKREIYIYAEDDGMDLLNEVVGEYEADKAYPIDHYINKYASGAGFEIGINEVANLTRKLSWDGESTATARIASVATQFDGCEVSYSFKVSGLVVTKKYINIYKKRGKDIGITLRLNEDVDSIITKSSIGNLATALQCVGGTPEDAEEPITLNGYKYDDGDFYVDGTVLKSRKALEKWSRFLWKTDETQKAGGHITKQFSYDTPVQQTLCAHAITELKKICDTEVNYKVEISKLPDNVKIGDRVNIVDDEGQLYLSTRILQLETSVADQESKATLGEHLIKGSGIHQKVAELAEQFAKNTVSAARALNIAKNAKTIADNAQTQANAAVTDAANAQKVAQQATSAANTATQSANAAQEAANNAQAAVGGVQESVNGLQESIANAQAAAEQAWQAAQTAESKVTEAHNAAVNAAEKATEAATAAGNAETKAGEAITTAETAIGAAGQAKTEAEKAATIAAAAKLDAATAQREIDSLADNLTTVQNTMSAEYARKTDLTKAEASLQSQITQNAAGISSTAKKVQSIDETTNDAQKHLQGALAWAAKAEEEAEQARIDADEAQAAADEAEVAALAAEAEAASALQAAETAQAVTDQAEAALAAAIEDLQTIEARADATEAEIESAQQAVEAARTAANTARAESITAKQKAAEAQEKANAAILTSNTAQEIANKAASDAAIAQTLAENASGDAAEAQRVADEAAALAAEAVEAANTAVENAENAQNQAIAAEKAAIAAENTATAAQAKADQASQDLAQAQEQLENVLADTEATELEVAQAQAAVDAAQIAADKAAEEAMAAQESANVARTNAINAQNAADQAKAAADQAQAEAEAARKAATIAQGEVNGLAVRLENAETVIMQNASKIALMATRQEVKQTLGGYYTKEEAKAEIKVSADAIENTVRKEINGLEIGARNLIRNSVNLIDPSYFFMAANNNAIVGQAIAGTAVVGKG